MKPQNKNLSKCPKCGANDLILNLVFGCWPYKWWKNLKTLHFWCSNPTCEYGFTKSPSGAFALDLRTGRITVKKK